MPALLPMETCNSDQPLPSSRRLCALDSLKEVVLMEKTADTLMVRQNSAILSTKRILNSNNRDRLTSPHLLLQLKDKKNKKKEKRMMKMMIITTTSTIIIITSPTTTIINNSK